MIRSFIAIPLPQTVKQSLEEIQKELRLIFPEVNWVKASNIHLTIKFLGNIEETQISALKQVMAVAAEKINPFSLQGYGLGAFPSLNRARVIWIGLQGDLAPLKALHNALEKGLTQLGFPEENRNFAPHLTLGRIKKRINTQLLSKIVEKYGNFTTPSFIVKEIVLFKSELHPKGAKYTVLEKIIFKKE